MEQNYSSGSIILNPLTLLPGHRGPTRGYHFARPRPPARAHAEDRAAAPGFHAYGQDQDAYEIDIRLEACLVKYRSLYPEVRAVRSPFDDPETPVETFRSYFLGIVWVVIGSFVNETPGEPRQPGTLPVRSMPRITVAFAYPSSDIVAQSYRR
ncbi:hypothetical protein V1506DRAFT_509002 [Lipomyces tetrasporus]